MIDVAIEMRVRASALGRIVHSPTWLYGFLFSTLSAGIFLLNTRHGIGVEPDTTRYMRLGPESYDDPLYVWVLDLIRMAGVPFETGAKAFALIMVAANSWAIWRLLLRGTASLPHAVAGTMLILLSPQFIGVHATAMSEAPFFGCLFLVVFTALRFLETQRTGWLIGCGIALGLAMLARFAAFPMALALATILLADPRRSVPRRVGRVALLALTSGALFFGWLIENKLSGGHGTGRALAFDGSLGVGDGRDFVDIMSTFLLPSRAGQALGGAILLIVVGGTFLLFVREGRSLRARAASLRSSDEAIPLIWGLFAAFYLPFMALALMIEANLRLDGRYLLPFYMAVVLTAGCLMARRSRLGVEQRIGWTFAALSCVVLMSHVVRAGMLTRSNYNDGISYASVAWRTSPTVQAVRQLPCDAAIFSISPDALNYLTHRKAKFTPLRYARRTGREDPRHRAADVLARIRHALEAGNGYLVFFDLDKDRFYAMPEEEVVARLRPPLIRREADGRIYGPYPGRSQARSTIPTHGGGYLCGNS